MADKDENLTVHLEALRATLISCLRALGIGLLPMLAAAPWVLRLLIKIILGHHDIALNFFAPTEVFMLQIKVAVTLDLIVCFPYMAHKIWLFVLPALYEQERRFIKSIALVSSSLFVLGALFCLFFILPMLINFGMSFASAELKAMFGVSGLISTTLWLAVIFGLMFQFPLITYALIRSGLTSAESVRRKRPYVAVGILIMAALLTPPDIVSQILLATPTYLLFESGLFFGGRHK